MSWRLQLKSPAGEVFDLAELGCAKIAQEHEFAMPEIYKYLKQYDETTVLHIPYQMLLNPNFYLYHSYRLTWGETSPTQPHAAYPEKHETFWTLYNNNKPVLTGWLPRFWYLLDDNEKQVLINEQRYNVLHSM